MPNISKLNNAAGQRITNVADPGAAQDAATKASSEAYADSGDGSTLTLAKAYADAGDALKLSLTGGTMSGAIAMATKKITGLGDPTLAQDAATKAYSDAKQFLKDNLGNECVRCVEKEVALGFTEKLYVNMEGGVGELTSPAKSMHLIGDSFTGVIWGYYDQDTDLPMVPTFNAELVNKLYADTKIAKLAPSVQYRVVVDDGAGEIEDTAVSILDEGEAGSLHRLDVFTASRGTPKEGDLWVRDSDPKRWIEQNFNGEVRTAELIGSQGKYFDLEMPLTGGRLFSPSSDIVYDEFNVAMNFKSSAVYPTDEVTTLAEITHGYIEGTGIKVYMQWLQQQAAMPNWLIAYKVVKIGELSSIDTNFTTANWTKAAYTSNEFTWSSGVLAQTTEFPTISGTGLKIAHRILFVLFRDVSNVSGLFAGAEAGTSANEYVHELDCRIQVDSLGSEEEYVK